MVDSHVSHRQNRRYRDILPLRFSIVHNISPRQHHTIPRCTTRLLELHTTNTVSLCAAPTTRTRQVPISEHRQPSPTTPNHGAMSMHATKIAQPHMNLPCLASPAQRPCTFCSSKTPDWRRRIMELPPVARQHDCSCSAQRCIAPRDNGAFACTPGRTPARR
jgi:hypothetical protein